MIKRPRRNRRTPAIRQILRETHLKPADLVLPLFVMDQQGRESIPTMPGCARLGYADLIDECTKAYELGVKAVALFPKVSESLKDSHATFSYADNNFYLEMISRLKKELPDLILFTDVAMDPYSSDGHDGIVRNGEVLNDETLDVLAKMSVAQARAGSDYISPSDMMDGRVGYIRHALEREGFINTGIMAYSAKYASAFYGPFRDALDSAPKSGDKKTYQMDPANRVEAKREVLADIEEGADIVMVKPALSYLDIIRQSKEISNVPVAAYFVSGEYAMIKAAGQLGYLDEQAAMTEAVISIKRAGADLIFTYAAIDIARELSTL